MANFSWKADLNMCLALIELTDSNNTCTKKKMSTDPVLEALLDGDWKVLHTCYPTKTGQDLLFSKDSKK